MEKKPPVDKRPGPCRRGNCRTAGGRSRYGQREALPNVREVSTPVSRLTVHAVRLGGPEAWCANCDERPVSFPFRLSL